MNFAFASCGPWRPGQFVRWARSPIGFTKIGCDDDGEDFKMGLMKVIGDDSNELLRSVREIQFAVEMSIENMRQVRADLDNAVANLLEQQQQRRKGVRR